MKDHFRGATLLRVQLLDSSNDWLVKVPPQAAPFMTGARICLFRPQGANDEQIKQAPPAVRLQVDTASPLSLADQSIERMQKVARAFVAYYTAHQQYPPAAVVGPDDKPWHSWRALLLPYLEDQKELAEQYDLSQPWDSEHNQRLLGKMPEPYADPFAGEGEGSFTNVAALVGEDAAFPAHECKLKDAEAVMKFSKHPKSFRHGAGAVALHYVLDGHRSTIMLASVGATRRIPWLQPVDLRLTAASKPRGGFAFLRQSGGQAAALVLFADMRSALLPAAADDELVRAMCTASGEDAVSHDPSRATAISVSIWSICIDGNSAIVTRGGP